MAREPSVPEVERQVVPVMLDAAGVRRFFGVTESMAEFLMRQMPRRVEPAGKRKVFVYTADLMDYLASQEKR